MKSSWPVDTISARPGFSVQPTPSQPTQQSNSPITKYQHDDIEVDKAKIDIITSLPNPTYMWGVCSFLGHTRFYKRFIKNFSKIALSLSKLLQKDVEFKFDQPYIEAFQELKSQLTSTPILQAPDWEFPFELMCDASNSALGAVLGQRARVGQPTHKPDAKLRLIRWMLLLQEFNREIRRMLRSQW
ncbi:Retrovirus-related Pol polyprotein, partial [Mucuna pruriens]